MQNSRKQFNLAFLMCVPVLIFGFIAWQTSQRDSFLGRYFGPFRVFVQDVRPIEATAYDAREGRNFAWEMRLNAHGPKPAWWGQSIRMLSANSKRWQPKEVTSRLVMTNNGTVRELPPDWILWTTAWDKEQQLYTARLEANGDNWPQAAQVRWQGKISIREADNPPVSKPIPFDIVLKEAGKAWPKPHFSRDPQLKIKAIKIVKTSAQEHNALVTLESLDGGHTFITQPKFEDAQGRKIEVSRFSVGFSSFITSRLATGEQNSKGTVKDAYYLWYPDELRNAPRDVFFVATTTAHKRWPLQFRFPVKRNGKPLMGKVPFTTRSAPPRD